MLKECAKCHCKKDINDFSPHKAYKDGRFSYCKKCVNQNVQRLKKLDPEKVKISNAKSYKKHKEKRLKKQKEYVEKNKEIIYSRNRNYSKTHRKQLNISKLKREKANPLYKLACILRSRITKVCKYKQMKKLDNFLNYTGCSVLELKQHLENQFKDNMSWDNYGKNGWHIDHIIPLSSAKSEEELMKLCHYTNLQPLWAKDNLIKGSKIPEINKSY